MSTRRHYPDVEVHVVMRGTAGALDEQAESAGADLIVYLDGEPASHDDQHARAVASRVERALTGEGIYAVYQPIMNLRTGRVVGAGGVRPVPRRRRCQPARPPRGGAAVGLRRELELAAVLAAVDQIELLPAAWFLAVNLSPATLMWSEFLDRLDELPLGRMWLEVNVRDEPTAWFERFSDLWPDGVARPQMALDDTGATSASLKAIHQLEPDVVKVAPELVRGDRPPARPARAGVDHRRVRQGGRGGPAGRRGGEQGRGRHAGEPRRAPGPGVPVRCARSARSGAGAGAEAPVAGRGRYVRPVTAVIMDGKALAETVRAAGRRAAGASWVRRRSAWPRCSSATTPRAGAMSRRSRSRRRAVGIASPSHRPPGRRHPGRGGGGGGRAWPPTRPSTASSSSCRCRAGLAADPVIDLIPPLKDVDGLTAASLGRLVRGSPAWCRARPGGSWPCSRTTRCRSRGRRAVVIGRSTLVGLPVALLLATKGTDATVTIAHSRSADLAGVCREADILVSAVGVGRLVTPDFVKPGAAVLDVGISRTEAGIVGDVDFDAVAEVAGWITPMPGGTGAMTPAMLLENTVDAYCAQQGKVV